VPGRRPALVLDRDPRAPDPRGLQRADPRAGRRRHDQRGVGGVRGPGLRRDRRIDEIARIEVIRGPVSSVDGTNGVFGIMSIVTRGAAEAPRAWARATGQTINGVLTSAGFAVGGVDRQLRGAVHFLNRFGESGLPMVDGITPQSYGDHGRTFNAGLV